jgi:hypothetical protein
MSTMCYLVCPKCNCLIIASAGEGLSIRAEWHTLNSACMSGERLEYLSCLRIPELNRVVCTPTGEGLSIGTKCYTPNSTCMPVEPSAPFLKGDRKRGDDDSEVSWVGVPTPRVWPAD